MIDTPVTGKFYKKLELFLELNRQNNRAKKSPHGSVIWAMEKTILNWAVSGHWHLGTALTPDYLKERLKEKGFGDDQIKDVRKVSQNLIARNFAYHPANESDDDTIQLRDSGFLMGEIIEESGSVLHLVTYGLFIVIVWIAGVVAAMQIIKQFVLFWIS